LNLNNISRSVRFYDVHEFGPTYMEEAIARARTSTNDPVLAERLVNQIKERRALAEAVLARLGQRLR